MGVQARGAEPAAPSTSTRWYSALSSPASECPLVNSARPACLVGGFPGGWGRPELAERWAWHCQPLPGRSGHRSPSPEDLGRERSAGQLPVGLVALVRLARRLLW